MLQPNQKRWVGREVRGKAMLMSCSRKIKEEEFAGSDDSDSDSSDD